MSKHTEAGVYPAHAPINHEDNYRPAFSPGDQEHTLSLLTVRPIDAIHACVPYPGVDANPHTRDVTQNTFFRVDTLTDGALD